MSIADNEILRGHRRNCPFLFEDYEINQTRDKMIDLVNEFFEAYGDDEAKRDEYRIKYKEKENEQSKKLAKESQEN